MTTAAEKYSSGTLTNFSTDDILPDKLHYYSVLNTIQKSHDYQFVSYGKTGFVRGVQCSVSLLLDLQLSLWLSPPVMEPWD